MGFQGVGALVGGGGGRGGGGGGGEKFREIPKFSTVSFTSVPDRTSTSDGVLDARRCVYVHQYSFCELSVKSFVCQACVFVCVCVSVYVCVCVCQLWLISASFGCLVNASSNTRWK